MKSKLLLTLVFVLLTLVIFALSGCFSPPPPPPPPLRGESIPFTPFILQRLITENNFVENSGRYQFLLSGGILLEREETRSSSNVDEKGAAVLESTYVRENITINDKTLGQVMSLGRTGGEIFLSLCFEDNTELQLVFSAARSPDALFYLTYNPNETLSSSNEKGNLMYGKDEYRIKFNGEQRPFLLLLVSRNEKELLETRTVPGRSVKNPSSSF